MELSAFEAYGKFKKPKTKKLKREEYQEETHLIDKEYRLLKKTTKSFQNGTSAVKTKKLARKQERKLRHQLKMAKTPGHSKGDGKQSSDSDSEKNCDVVQKRENGTSSMKGLSKKVDAIIAKKRKSSNPPEEDILDGDGVLLVEAVAEDLMNDSDNSSDSVGARGGLYGENIMNTVIKLNADLRAKKKKSKVSEETRDSVDSDESEGEFTKDLRAKFGLSGKEKIKKVKKGGKMRKVDVSGSGGSIEEGKKCLGWLLNPIPVDRFLSETWEKRPLHIQRTQHDYYKHILSTKSFDSILRGDKPVLYGKNLDVTSYTKEDGEGNGGRETHNPVGRAYAPVVWDYFNNGCSLRMLNPQTFHEPVWKLCATLQDFMGSMVGANVYLTPPGTQGFAPHYDDVDVFILQLEGKKHWRLYEPRTAREQLPRYSSSNFKQDEIGTPYLETVLEAGDMLYMPRGTIHQGDCLEDVHSLHITISCNQLNSFGNLLEKIVPVALSTAIEEDVEFRRGLPINYLSHLGVANSDNNTTMRRDFVERVRKLMSRLFTYAPVDAACDQMAKKFLHDSLPPYLTSDEASRCVDNGGERWHAGKARVVNRVEIDPNTEICLIRAHCLRLITEDDNTVRIYYNVDNTREYHEMEEQYLEIDPDTAPAVEMLISSYPKYITADQLPIETMELKMSVVQNLWERKLLLTRQVLEAHYDD